MRKHCQLEELFKKANLNSKMQQASEACPTKHMVLSNELRMREVRDTYSPPFKANWWGVKKAAFY